MFVVDELPRSHAAILRLSLRDPAAAVEQAVAIAGGRRPIANNAIDNYTLGCALLAQEQVLEAVPFLELALAACLAAGDDMMALHCRRALLRCALDTRHPTATDPWETLIADYQAKGAVGEAARTAVQLAGAWYNHRESPRVRAVTERWMPLLDEAHAYERGCFHRLVGAAFTNEKSFAEAEQSLRQAKDVFESHGYRPELAHCWMIEGWARTLQGDFEDAQARFSQAEAVFEDCRLAIRRALCANNRSICSLQQSKFPQTLFYSHQARQLFQENDRLLDIGACDLLIGRVYLQIGHWVAARTEFFRATTIFSELNATGRLASCYYNTAYVLVEQGDLAAAESMLRRAREIAEERNNWEILEVVMMLSAKCLAIKGDYGASAREYEATSAYFARRNNPVGVASCGLELGWIAHDRGDYKAAGAAFAAALPSLESQPALAWRIMHGLARCAEAAGKWQPALNWYNNAIRIVSSIRHQLANEHLSSVLFNQALALLMQATRCVLQHGTPLDVLQLTEQQRTLTLLRLLATKWQERNSTRLHQVEEQLRVFMQHKNPQSYSQAMMPALDHILREYARQIWFDRHSAPASADIDLPPGIDVAAVREECCRRHGSEWTILLYTTHETAFLLTVLTASDLWNIVLPWPDETEAMAKKLNNDRYKWAIYQDRDFRSGRSPRRWQVLETLARCLLPQAVRDRLGPDHRLYIVPSRTLHTIPWATLRIGDQWLCERSIIQIMPHLMFITRPAGAMAAPALFLGCSDFPAPTQPLTFVPFEVERLAQTWDGPADMLLEEACSIRIAEPAQADQWRKYGLIHIATHAYMVKDQGIASHIVLNDGNLWLETISQLPINGALVVLSTCSGAVVDMLPGEENLSLSWSWLIAGAGGVLASVWTIYDGSTFAVLEHVYRHLIGGVDSAAALALAQRECIRSEASPTAWGSFILTGGELLSRA